MIISLIVLKKSLPGHLLARLAAGGMPEEV
jgi:hypothetical protein